jgi:radical SAM protein with 4Fe4S-binding SPASM domain
MKQNEHEIKDFKQFTTELGADRFFFSPVHIYSENDVAYLPENPLYRKYSLDYRDGAVLKGKINNLCSTIWKGCIVLWNGEIKICCMDFTDKYKIGNINEKPLKTLWKSKEYMVFRKAVLNHKKDIEICKLCQQDREIDIDVTW